MKKRRFVVLLLILLISLVSSGCRLSPEPQITTANPPITAVATTATPAGLNADGRYSSPADVAAYLHQFGHLPNNFITKDEAIELGWESNQGNLWDVTDQLSIGGDLFGNREGRLPDAQGRQWFECDVNYYGGFRGAERLVYSNDGLVYYTTDHYVTFVRLY